MFIDNFATFFYNFIVFLSLGIFLLFLGLCSFSSKSRFILSRFSSLFLYLSVCRCLMYSLWLFFVVFRPWAIIGSIFQSALRGDKTTTKNLFFIEASAIKSFVRSRIVRYQIFEKRAKIKGGGAYNPQLAKGLMKIYLRESDLMSYRDDLTDHWIKILKKGKK